MKAVISIDPGRSGGIAWRDQDGVTHAEVMPQTFPEIADRLLELRVALSGPRCVLEKVGMHRVGNNASASAKFARHCGHLEAILYTLSIPTTQITPQAWMKKMGSLPKDKKDRKNKIKEIAATQYPHLKVTLKTSDALAILMTEVERG